MALHIHCPRTEIITSFIAATGGGQGGDMAWAFVSGMWQFSQITKQKLFKLPGSSHLGVKYPGGWLRLYASIWPGLFTRDWGRHVCVAGAACEVITSNALCQGRLSWAQWPGGAGVPPPLMFEFDKVFLCLAKFGVKLQKYWRVDPVPGKINFTHFLTWPALIRALEEWRNFKFGTTQWSGVPGQV